MDVGWNRKKNFIQPPETPYEKKIVFLLCFSRLLRLLCKLRVSDQDRPLACKDEEEWVFVVALYLFVRIFYVILKKSDLQRLCRNNRPQTSVEMSFITTICFGVQKLLVD